MEELVWLFCLCGGFAMGLLCKQSHIIQTLPEDQLMVELKRRRFEASVRAQTSLEVDRELQVPRPPPAPMTKKE